MPNPFKDPDTKKWSDCYLPATKADLNEMEDRLTALIVTAVTGGEKHRIEELTAKLKAAADTLQSAVDKNKQT